MSRPESRFWRESLKTKLDSFEENGAWELVQDISAIQCKWVFENKYDSPNTVIIGRLMHLAVLTRTDIAYSVWYLSQFIDSYNVTQWKCAKKVSKSKIVFRKDNFSVGGYVDAGWVSITTNRESYTGWGFELDFVISFNCRKHRNVALFITEAEYISIWIPTVKMQYINKIYHLKSLNDWILLNCLMIVKALRNWPWILSSSGDRNI